MMHHLEVNPHEYAPRVVEKKCVKFLAQCEAKPAPPGWESPWASVGAVRPPPRCRARSRCRRRRGWPGPAPIPACGASSDELEAPSNFHGRTAPRKKKRRRNLHPEAPWMFFGPSKWVVFHSPPKRRNWSGFGPLAGPGPALHWRGHEPEGAVMISSELNKGNIKGTFSNWTLRHSNYVVEASGILEPAPHLGTPKRACLLVFRV